MLKIRNKLLKKSEKGFTLVELIVVIAILGVLALIAVPRVLGSLDDAKASVLEANIRTLNSAVALYLAEDKAIPADPTAANVYAELVNEDLMQADLDLTGITYDATSNMFKKAS